MSGWTLLTAVAFNLSCEGTFSRGIGPVGNKVTTEGTFATEFRIDLSQGRWCDGDCAETRLIKAAQTTKIVLREESDPPRRILFMDELNRETGAYFGVVTLGDMTEARSGKCAVRPFSGFPARKF